MTEPSLLINEIFFSIQGESTWAGCPCLFVRLAGCHLRCTYCDTEYAFHEGRRMGLDQIIAEVRRLTSPPPGEIEGGKPKGSGANDLALRPLAQITGGEPLLQPNVHPLITRLADRGYTVLIETSGACDISACDPRAIRIMDLKTPGSGEVDRNDWANLNRLNERDEVKFVITNRSDFDWARDVVMKHYLADRVHAVLFSPAHAMPPGKELPGTPGLNPRDLAEWILADPELASRVRMQTQMHKIIWDPMQRGV